MKWIKSGDIEEGLAPRVTAAGHDELREARKRVRLLEQKNEVLRRAAAYLSQAKRPGDGCPCSSVGLPPTAPVSGVTVTCRV